MKTWLLFLIMTVAFSIEGIAQNMFQRVYGGESYDAGCEVIQTPDDGYLIAGTTGSFGLESGQIMLLKTDFDGYEEWRRYYGGELAEQAASMQISADGHLLIGGLVETVESGYQMYALKLTMDGDSIWSRSYGTSGWDFCRQLVALPDGGFALFGQTINSQATEGDFYLVRIDADGDTLWTRTYGGEGMESGESIALAADGGFYMAGHTDSYGAGKVDMYVVRTDENGDTLWTRTVGGPEDDHCFGIALTADGGYVLAGGTYNLTPDKSDFVLHRLDGNLQWTKFESKPGYNVLTDVIIEPGTENVTVAGYGTEGTDFGGEDFRILRYGVDGVWNGVAKFHGSEGNERAADIKLTSDFGYVMVGHTTGFLGRFDDVYFIKTDHTGASVPPELAVNEILIDGTSFNVSIGPNPFSGASPTLYVQNYETLVTRIDDPIMFRMFDAVGKVVYERRVRSGSERMDALQLADGIYHYQLLSGDRLLATGKAVKLN